MANSVNKATLIGHLGKDPETRALQGGNSVTNFSVATSEKWKDKSGDLQEKTEWHRVTAWGKLGEICAEYLQKGSQVYIEGRIETQQYEKDGEKRSMTQIVAKEVVFLGGKGSSSRDGAQQASPRQTEPAASKPPVSDDVPF